MDLYQLRYFLEAARELNFSRAAANLLVSPSAVSRSIGLLERSVRKKLFSRNRRRVVLSVAGESLKARAERIFDEIERARAELEGESRAPALLRIGSREMITNYLLPGPLARFSERWGETRIGIYELGPEAMASAIKKDQLDLGFYYAPIPDPMLESRVLGKLRSHVYASARYLNSRPRLKGPRDVPRLPFVAPRSFGEDPASARADGYPDQRLPRNIRYEVEFLETHRRFVLDGLCVGVLPDLVLEPERKRGEVVALPGPSIHREIRCFQRRGRTPPEAVDFLVAAIRAAIAAAPRG